MIFEINTPIIVRSSGNRAYIGLYGSCGADFLTLNKVVDILSFSPSQQSSTECIAKFWLGPGSIIFDVVFDEMAISIAHINTIAKMSPEAYSQVKEYVNENVTLM
jgi:predicted ATP-grasp superfamily ATP-dependent carboligase